MKPKVLVLTGFGINCDVETEFVFNLPVVGACAERVHLNDVLDGRKKINDYQIFAVPGGFSFGDDIASGRVLANLMRAKLMDDLREFIAAGKPMIGICNGFQALTKMGLLPAWDPEQQQPTYGVQTATLTTNDRGKFEDRWVYLKVNPSSNCVWTKGLEQLYLPIRHGEGKFVFKTGFAVDDPQVRSQIVLTYTDQQGTTDPQYPDNPNGSEYDIAGMCDPTGLIFGLMPHPEAYWNRTNHPRWTREPVPEEGVGVALFRNAVQHVVNGGVV